MTLFCCRSQQLVDIWTAAAAAAAGDSSLPSPAGGPQGAGRQGKGSGQGGFVTDVATQTQRLTLDIVGLVAFSHDFKQVEQVLR